MLISSRNRTQSVRCHLGHSTGAIGKSFRTALPLKIVTDYLTLDQLNLAKTLTEAHAIHFDFWQAKDLFIHIEPTDMLFLETSRTYCHLTYELESFSSHVRKYICIHGTSGPWSHENGEEYYVNYSDYETSYDRIKATYDRTKKGYGRLYWIF